MQGGIRKKNMVLNSTKWETDSPEKKGKKVSFSNKKTSQQFKTLKEQNLQ